MTENALSDILLLRVLCEGGDKGHRHPQCCECVCHENCAMTHVILLGVLSAGPSDGGNLQS